MRRSLLVISLLAGCGTDAAAPPSAPVPTSLVLISGDSQTTQVFQDFHPLLVRLFDSSGTALVGYPILAVTSDLYESQDTTDSYGEVQLTVRAGSVARQFSLPITVDEPPYYGQVTTSATLTVLPGPPALVTFREVQQSALLGVTIDVDHLATSLTDVSGNAISIIAESLATPPPYELSGHLLTSHMEVGQDLNDFVNGHPFAIRFNFLRDLRVLAGAHGSWECSADEGLPDSSGPLMVDQKGQLVIDSVVAGGVGDDWQFYLDLMVRDSLTDARVVEHSGSDHWEIFFQVPGAWSIVYAGSFHQDGDSPLSYIEDEPGSTFCQGWHGNPSFSPLVITQ